MFVRRAAAIAAMAVAATTLVAGPASAAGYDVTANGKSNGETLTRLPSSSTVDLVVTDLPENVGLYALHCLVPDSQFAPPTRCDASSGALAYIVASDVARDRVEQALTVNKAFEGRNPNPTSGDAGTTDVNCRAQACAIYVLGAGAASADPQWLRVFPTSFAPPQARKADHATVIFKGEKVNKHGKRPTVHYRHGSDFTVKLRSGIEPSLSSPQCKVSKEGRIRALKKRGVCTVTITSPGNDVYKPLKRKVTFRLEK